METKKSNGGWHCSPTKELAATSLSLQALYAGMRAAGASVKLATDAVAEIKKIRESQS